MKLIFLTLINAAIITCLMGAPVTIELPRETSSYKPGPGVELAQAFCMNCHSADYTSSQPQMPRKFWEATVTKMKDKYGAVLPGDSAPLIDYLSKSYGKP